MNICTLKLSMINCDQTPGMTVLEHGESVSSYYKDLIQHLRTGSELKYEWDLPDWIKEVDLTKLLPDDVMETYHVYHDCGKPLCIKFDDQGRRHFPNHAQVSHDVWLAVGGDP